MAESHCGRQPKPHRAARALVALALALLASDASTELGTLDGCGEDFEASFDYSADNLTVRFVPRIGEGADVSAYLWDFGDGTSSAKRAPAHTYETHGTYAVTLSLEIVVSGVSPPQTCVTTVTTVITFVRADRCCASSFALEPGHDYVLGAWTKESMRRSTAQLDLELLPEYPSPRIHLLFKIGEVFVESAANPFRPGGSIIDGWQRIEKEFQVPPGASELRIDLENEGPDEVFFDDIRIFPTQGNMKSFVYDPLTLRLMAELDERNYATFYEYDQEGALIRVKKETERGIMTIQESRNATHKNKP